MQEYITKPFDLAACNIFIYNIENYNNIENKNKTRNYKFECPLLNI